MDPYRTNKKNQAILEVLSGLIQSEVKDPRVGFVTINQVKLNRDHSVAEIYFSVMGDDDERQLSFQGLKKARGFMQTKLVRTLGLRAAPALRFVYDDSMVRAIDMGELLDGLKDRGDLMTDDERKRQMTLDDIEPPYELMQGLRRGAKFWLVPHHNPDPDTMGGVLALGEALRAMGREVRVLGYKEPAIGLKNLPGFDEVTVPDDPEALFAEERPDTLILVDFHGIERCDYLTGTLDRFENRFCIDHHLVSGQKAPVRGWLEPRSCSSCTLVYRVISTLAAGDEKAGDEPFALTVDMATNLYAGLVTDTGGFRFNNTVPFTFEFAQRLAEMGVDTAAVAAQTLHRHRREGMAMLQRVLATFDYHHGGRILVAHATLAMVQESGAVMADTEGFVNLATAVDGVRFVAFLKQLDEDVWRVSLRSCVNDGDVQVIAAGHGGGGHKMAAGCTIDGALSEVVNGLVGELIAAVG